MYNGSRLNNSTVLATSEVSPLSLESLRVDSDSISTDFLSISVSLDRLSEMSSLFDESESYSKSSDDDVVSFFFLCQYLY